MLVIELNQPGECSELVAMAFTEILVLQMDTIGNSIALLRAECLFSSSSSSRGVFKVPLL